MVLIFSSPYRRPGCRSGRRAGRGCRRPRPAAALRPRREVDHVGEEDRGCAELIGDRLRLRLELLGDRAGQDVEEQVLGLGLLDPKRVHGGAALLREQRQQGEDDRAPDHHVEREHRAREPGWRRRRDAAQHLPGDPRAQEDDDVRGVPLRRCSDVAEHEGPQGREDAPQAHASGVEEPTERDHRQRRREQDVQQVHPEQLGEVARAGEDADRAEQDGEVDDRHEADRRSERQVEDAPEQGDRQDQQGDQDQERLAGAGVLVVVRIGADRRHPGAHGTRRRSWCDAPGSRRDATRGSGEPGVEATPA